MPRQESSGTSVPTQLLDLKAPGVPSGASALATDPGPQTPKVAEKTPEEATEDDATGVAKQSAADTVHFPSKTGGNARTFQNARFVGSSKSVKIERPEFEETTRRTERVLGRESSGPEIASMTETIDSVMGRAMDELDRLSASMLTKAESHASSSGSSGALALAKPMKIVIFAVDRVPSSTPPSKGGEVWIIGDYHAEMLTALSVLGVD